MPLKKLIQTAAIFLIAFLFGIGWVGAFHFLAGLGQVDISLNGQVRQAPEPIGFGSGVAERRVSMDDPGFTPPQVDQQDPEAFDPEGIYTLIGSAPSVLQDLAAFVINNKNLDVDCDDENFGALVPATGFVLIAKDGSDIEDGARFAFKNLEISDDRVHFATKEVGGSAYEFSGEFVYKGNFYTLDPDAKVLSGKLVKFLNGKKIAETDVGFTWSIDLDCVC